MIDLFQIVIKVHSTPVACWLNRHGTTMSDYPVAVLEIATIMQLLSHSLQHLKMRCTIARSDGGILQT